MRLTNRSKALLGAAALALASGACQKQAGANSSPDAAKSAIKADEKSWNAQFKARDSEGLIGHYADDAFFVAPGVKGADGSTEIRKAYIDGLADPNFSISFASDKIDAASSGDMAYTRGHFSEKYTDPKTGKAVTGSGAYLTVYKKQDDGSWKAVEDFAAEDPDSVKPVPPAKPAVRAKMVSF